MVYNGILMETIGISVMVSIGLLLFIQFIDIKPNGQLMLKIHQIDINIDVKKQVEYANQSDYKNLT